MLCLVTRVVFKTGLILSPLLSIPSHRSVKHGKVILFDLLKAVACLTEGIKTFNEFCFFLRTAVSLPVTFLSLLPGYGDGADDLSSDRVR